ncbi:MAG: SWIM zinc finger family protein [Pseudomonadota bacterium]
MAAFDQTYRYAGSSALRPSAAGQSLRLVSDQSAQTDGPAHFLSARALAPDVTAKGLRAVSEVVGARFYTPPSMVARLLREADPVATVSPGAVRFEGFSACCSVYARMDLGDDALDTTTRRNGTTNVDFGPELRAALAGVGPETELELGIGADAVDVTRDGARVVERKVPLPLRWVKGFGQVQVALAGMAPVFTLSRLRAQRFLRALPRGASDHAQWVALAPGGAARLSTRPATGAVPLRGGHRLRVLEPMVARAEALEVHHDPGTQATAWSLVFGAQRFTLVLNAEPWRGFSGDGGLLSNLATSDGAATATVRAWLNWQERIDPEGLCGATALEPGEVQSALAELAALGLVGYDLGQGGYFHRVLPFDAEQIAALNPRLDAARALVAAGKVTLDGTEATVESDDVVHRVRPAGDGWSCTCPWYAKTAGGRGSCKHILAVEITLETCAWPLT